MKNYTCGCEGPVRPTRESIVAELEAMQDRAEDLKGELKSIDEMDEIYKNSKHCAKILKAGIEGFVEEGFTREEAIDIILASINSYL